MRNLVVLFVIVTSAILAGCGGSGVAPITFVTIPDVPPQVNDLGHLIAEQQRSIVWKTGGDVWKPSFSDNDRAAFERSGKLAGIVAYVKGTDIFKLGVIAIRTLSPEKQNLVWSYYETPIDKTWKENGEIGNGTTDAGYMVEQEIAIALTDAVKAAL